MDMFFSPRNSVRLFISFHRSGIVFTINAYRTFGFLFMVFTLSNISSLDIYV